jgi:hypothetical protein
MSRGPRHRADPPPDIEIDATARARQLRFGRVPRTDVSFETEPEGESSSNTHRENLPDRVKPGVTHRNVRVRWRADARLISESESLPGFTGPSPG